MRVMFRFCLISLMPLTTTHCGRDTHQSDLSSGYQSPPLFIVMGGNATCEPDKDGGEDSPFASGLFLSFKQRIYEPREASGLATEALITCYGSDAVVVNAWASNPDDVSRDDQLGFADKVLSAMQEEREIYLIGHSYGGWLSMKLASHLNEQNTKIKGLFTVDPISRKYCTFSLPTGCQQFPGDISKQAQLALKEGSELWHNYYQTQTWYLHSASAEHADKNQKFPVSHSNIDSHAPMWDEISQLSSVASDYQVGI
jgi:pimeloyl-ACP methyl ester carboxylesterase